jgi:transposase-like protein
MEKRIRREYTAQTKADAAGQVLKAGLRRKQVARSFEMPEHTLDNWVRNAKNGNGSVAAGTPAKVSISEQDAEISKLKALCARLTMERDILKKSGRRTLQGMRCEVRLDRAAPKELADQRHVPRIGFKQKRLLRQQGACKQ